MKPGWLTPPYAAKESNEIAAWSEGFAARRSGPFTDLHEPMHDDTSVLLENNFMISTVIVRSPVYREGINKSCEAMNNI